MAEKVVITGGGTGGHVFPALAIAEELRARGIEVLYVGTAHGMEAKLVPPKGFAFHTLKTGAVKNQTTLKKLKTVCQLVLAIGWSVRFLRAQRVRAVVGVGGYVSVPMCVAGFLLRLPVFLQEQNASVGIANRFLGKLARTIFLGFKDAQKYFNPRKCLWTGNPVRKEFLAADFPALQPERLGLFIFGGSQGAKAINDAVLELLPEILKRHPNARIVHQTGEKDFERVSGAYREKAIQGVEVIPFVHDMGKRYAEASLVISRSGALTVSELIQVGRPSILVPFPRRGQNDQVDNAAFLEHHGVARVVPQGERFTERLRDALESSFQPSALREMARGFSTLRTSDGIVTIGDRITEAVRSN